MGVCDFKKEHEESVEKAKANMPSGAEIERICNLLKILGEPSRMKIVLALLQGEECVYHIVQAVGGTQSAVSHQLRILKDGQIVKARRDGQNVLYSLADRHVEEIIVKARLHASCLVESEE